MPRPSTVPALSRYFHVYWYFPTYHCTGTGTGTAVPVPVRGAGIAPSRLADYLHESTSAARYSCI